MTKKHSKFACNFHHPEYFFVHTSQFFLKNYILKFFLSFLKTGLQILFKEKTRISQTGFKNKLISFNNFTNITFYTISYAHKIRKEFSLRVCNWKITLMFSH